MGGPTGPKGEELQARDAVERCARLAGPPFAAALRRAAACPGPAGAVLAACAAALAQEAPVGTPLRPAAVTIAKRFDALWQAAGLDGATENGCCIALGVPAPPPLPRELLARAAAVIQHVTKLHCAEAFAAPVDIAAAPGYANVVNMPMDLSTLAERLAACRYAEPLAVFADAELIWTNCFTYNEPSDALYHDGVELRANFQLEWAAAGLPFEVGQKTGGEQRKLPTVWARALVDEATRGDLPLPPDADEELSEQEREDYDEDEQEGRDDREGSPAALAPTEVACEKLPSTPKHGSAAEEDNAAVDAIAMARVLSPRRTRRERSDRSRRQLPHVGFYIVLLGGRDDTAQTVGRVELFTSARTVRLTHIVDCRNGHRQKKSMDVSLDARRWRILPGPLGSLLDKVDAIEDRAHHAAVAEEHLRKLHAAGWGAVIDVHDQEFSQTLLEMLDQGYAPVVSSERGVQGPCWAHPALRVARVAVGEGMMVVEDVPARATLLKEVGFCALQKNAEASAGAVLVASEASMLRRLCDTPGGPDKEGPDSFSPIAGVTTVAWNAARRQVAANAYKDDACSYLHGFGSKFNHSCAPNAQWSIDASGRYKVTAIAAIQAGDEVTIRYSQFAGGSNDVFSCRCAACKAKHRKGVEPVRHRKIAQPVPLDGVPIPSAGASVGPEHWCICKGGATEDMIACESGRCKYEWFHFACVGLTQDDADKLEDEGIEWLCPACTETGKRKRDLGAADGRPRKMSKKERLAAAKAAKEAERMARQEAREAAQEARRLEREAEAERKWLARQTKAPNGWNAAQWRAARLEMAEEAAAEAEAAGDHLVEVAEVAEPPEWEEEEEEGARWCLCRGPASGDMIACESIKCAVEWFHYRCVGLSRRSKLPAEGWRCADCCRRAKKEAAAASRAARASRG